MSDRIKSFLIYAAKCVAGTLTVYTIASLIHYNDIGWTLISVMLVLSPNSKESVPLAVTRIKANVVGASMGLLCLFISHNNMWILSVALTLTVAICYLFNLDTGIRSALASTIIIMLHEEGKHLWDNAIERVIAVMAGCILGLIVTFVFRFNITADEKQIGNSHQEA